jgi:hypothetical protein
MTNPLACDVFTGKLYISESNFSFGGAVACSARFLLLANCVYVHICPYHFLQHHARHNRRMCITARRGQVGCIRSYSITARALN